MLFTLSNLIYKFKDNGLGYCVHLTCCKEALCHLFFSCTLYHLKRERVFSLDKILYVGFGGFIGSVLRYGMSILFAFWAWDFPLATFLTNLIGAILIGTIMEGASLTGLNSNVLLFLKTGVCGGFTTFSTFSAETSALLEKGKLAVGFSYAFLSVILCVCGIWIGKILARLLFSKANLSL